MLSLRHCSERLSRRPMCGPEYRLARSQECAGNSTRPTDQGGSVSLVGEDRGERVYAATVSTNAIPAPPACAPASAVAVPLPSNC